MQPLVQSFTKNLSPCSGCGSSAVDYFVEQQNKGDKVKFILSVEVEADDLVKAITSDRSTWSVISGNPFRQPPQQGTVSGSQFQRSTTATIPPPQ